MSRFKDSVRDASVLSRDSAHAALDAWLDRRFESASAVEPLIESLSRAGLDIAGVESLLRAGHASYPEPSARRGEISGPHPLACDHVDHQVAYLLYLPSKYAHANSLPGALA